MIESVRPLHASTVAEPERAPPVTAAQPPKRASTAAPRRAVRPIPGETLDGSWDRRLSRGSVQPDFTVDLHGHSLHSAYTLLDHKLEQAIAAGARVLLLVTGKPPTERPVERGKIRDAVDDWLAVSRHAAHIAAVRGAHPRHGGAGALYIILRRRRP